MLQNERLVFESYRSQHNVWSVLNPSRRPHVIDLGSYSWNPKPALQSIPKDDKYRDTFMQIAKLAKSECTINNHAD